MDLQLKDKVVVVTGAAGLKGSIGETIIQALADEGAIPVIVCRNDRGYGYEKELQEGGIDSIFIKSARTPCALGAGLNCLRAQHENRIFGYGQNYGRHLALAP